MVQPHKIEFTLRFPNLWSLLIWDAQFFTSFLCNLCNFQCFILRWPMYSGPSPCLGLQLIMALAVANVYKMRSFRPCVHIILKRIHTCTLAHPLQDFAATLQQQVVACEKLGRSISERDLGLLDPAQIGQLHQLQNETRKSS